jgi:hypothetical protein
MSRPATSSKSGTAVLYHILVLFLLMWEVFVDLVFFCLNFGLGGTLLAVFIAAMKLFRRQLQGAA